MAYTYFAAEASTTQYEVLWTKAAISPPLSKTMLNVLNLYVFHLISHASKAQYTSMFVHKCYHVLIKKKARLLCL